MDATSVLVGSLDSACSPVTNHDNDLALMPRSSISNFNLRRPKFLSRIFSNKQKYVFRANSNINTKKDNKSNVCEMLKRSLMIISEASKDTCKKSGILADEFLHSLDQCKVQDAFYEDNGDPKPLKSNDSEHLDRFFTYIKQFTSEFNEEEALELQIRVLKVVRNIKAKREMKLHFRKYAAAMNIKDPLFCNN